MRAQLTQQGHRARALNIKHVKQGPAPQPITQGRTRGRTKQGAVANVVALLELDLPTIAVLVYRGLLQVHDLIHSRQRRELFLPIVFRVVPEFHENLP